MEDSQARVQTVHQLKIGIMDARPPLWRRVLVLSDTRLSKLHDIIQALFGWRDAHLHEFEAPWPGESNIQTSRFHMTERRYGPTRDPAGTIFDWLDEGQWQEESEVTLAEVVPAVKNRIRYTYDMGASWDHDILVEKILPADPDAAYPICVTGRRNGPIEDCGGIWGYEELLVTLANPQSTDHQQMQQWLKGFYGVSTWDGDTFDLAGINQRLKEL